jgi:hypothetical protein
VTFVNEVLSFQTAERVLLPQLADSVDGLANGLLESFPSGANCRLGEHFFDIHFERHTSRLGLCRQSIRYINPDLHKCNFSMRLKQWRVVRVECAPLQKRASANFVRSNAQIGHL